MTTGLAVVAVVVVVEGLGVRAGLRGLYLWIHGRCEILDVLNTPENSTWSLGLWKKNIPA